MWAVFPEYFIDGRVLPFYEALPRVDSEFVVGSR